MGFDSVYSRSANPLSLPSKSTYPQLFFHFLPSQALSMAEEAKEEVVEIYFPCFLLFGTI
jgi:hypothetical protein